MIQPQNNMQIDRSIIFDGGQHILPDGLAVTASNIVIDGQMTTINGHNRFGRGITLENCHHVTIKNFKLRNYYHGIYVHNCQHITIENCHITDSWERPANVDFLNIWLPAEQAYGGGIFLWEVIDSRIQKNDLQHQMNGILAYHCERLDVSHNIANYCSGFGFHLFNSSHNRYAHNQADFCCRYYQMADSRGHMGADAAGFLIVHNSSHNRFEKNMARLGGDGFFLAGLTPQGVKVPCNHNYFLANDGSYSPNIAFEATFSAHNRYESNIANHCNYGFWLGFSRDNHLQANQIVGNRQAGIAVENGFGMTVLGNNFRQNRHGLLLWSKYVPLFADVVPENDTSRNWHIERNQFVDNKKGIRIAADQDHGYADMAADLSRLLPRPHSHTIVHNQFLDNQIGIELKNTDSNNIADNIFRGNIFDER